jgi:hypothetical protein
MEEQPSENKILLRNIQRLLENQQREIALLQQEVFSLKHYIQQKDKEREKVLKTKLPSDKEISQGWFW